jgi:hypothetical protein
VDSWRETLSPKQPPQRAADDQHRVSVVAAHSHDDDLEGFYLDKGNAQSGQHLLSPYRVSLPFSCPVTAVKRSGSAEF